MEIANLPLHVHDLFFIRKAQGLYDKQASHGEFFYRLHEGFNSPYYLCSKFA